MLWLPTLKVESPMLVAVPLLPLAARVTAEPRLVPSTANWTVPVGGVEPEAGVTVAVKVTESPYFGELLEEETPVVVATDLLTL